ncbi:sialidase family protein [Mucilaginibacter pocheonensis]|uniref:Alpha-L-rhamnosidase n=1 Tax=Mucilaginibacter pocheonensis TaxID=398050 RepID=A0ABU1TF95_9SPHI|nr:sialidase family protein [Mucilaginibacter pocheonensis]MDR6943994.1 alpha-L-rhamnosidase [Mucilaginibacter pocheonensis]
MYKRILLIILSTCVIAGETVAQTNPWRKGILKDEFIYEKAPYPQCHASTIAETPKGLVASWFGGTKERNPDVCIWVSRLVNGKWTEAINVANGVQNDTLRYPCWNPVLYQVPGGDLLLFYKIGPSPAKWKGYIKTSADGGITWSAQRALPDNILGPIKNKPVLLKDGTLLSPTSTEGKGWQVHFEASKDFGKTWTLIGPINDGTEMKAIQPSILFHKDGSLQILCRSQNRAILTSWSKDNGKTWTPLQKTSLPNNNSGTDAVTLKDGRQLLVYNHVLPPGTAAKGARTPLNVSVSKDGVKWYAALILEDSPISQYSYPSVIQSSDGLVHIVYTWRRQRIKHVVVDPKKLDLKEIKNGEWPKVKGYTLPVIKGEVDELK